MGDGIFRRKSGFTAVDNNIARDKKISLKAKGLFLLIQSYITMPEATWLKSDFQRMTVEGQKAFESAWKELKELGYLKSHIMPNGKNGSRFATEFELLDEPVAGAHTFYYNSKGEITSTNLTKQARAKTKEKADNIEGELRYPQNGSNVIGTDVRGSNGNGGDNIILTTKTLSNTECNKSIIQSDETADRYECVIFGKIDVDLLQDVSDELSEQNGIPYSYATKRKRMQTAIQVMAGWDEFAQFYNYDDVHERAYIFAVECLCEIAIDLKGCEIGNSYVSYKNVIDQINKIFRENKETETPLMSFLGSVVDKFIKASKTREIPNTKAYMKAVIWNNFSTHKVDWDCFFSKTYYETLAVGEK